MNIEYFKSVHIVFKFKGQCMRYNHNQLSIQEIVKSNIAVIKKLHKSNLGVVACKMY